LTVLTNLASCYQSTRQYELALKYYNKAIEIDPNFVSAHDNLAATTKAADLFGDKDELAVAKESTRTYAKGEWRSALKKT
jgi:tetratricopeptide (TPR) repeat protein